MQKKKNKNHNNISSNHRLKEKRGGQVRVEDAKKRGGQRRFGTGQGV